MKKRVCSIMMSLVLLVYIPLSDYAAMKAFASSIPIYNSEVTAEVMMILWNLLMTGEIVSGVSQSNIGNYDWEKVTFRGFMDILAYDVLAPNSRYRDSVVLVLEDGRHIDLFEFMVETDCWFNENGELVDGTGALVIPSQETWEKYRVIDGGAGGEPEEPGEPDDPEPEDPFNHIQSVIVGNGLVTAIGDFISDIWNGEVEGLEKESVFYGTSGEGLPQYYFDMYEMNENNEIVVRGNIYYHYVYANSKDESYFRYFSKTTPYKVAGVDDGRSVKVWVLQGSKLTTLNMDCFFQNRNNKNGTITTTNISSSGDFYNDYNFNIPIFASDDLMKNYLYNGVMEGLLNGVPYDFTDLVHSTAGTLAPLEGVNLDPNALPGITTALENGLAALPAPGIDPAQNTNTYKQTVTDILTEAIPEAEVVPDSGTLPNPNPAPGTTPGTDSSSLDDYKVNLTGIFPFCIPFDFVRFIKVLSAEPEAPCFEFPFVVSSLGINMVYVIDLSFMEKAMEVFRVGELVSFVLMLMVATRKVIKW